jgi:circadian clock protein KaiC
MTNNGLGSFKPINTGISGLDEILNGGLVPNRSYLVYGRPGTGKSTLSFQYLMQGVKNSEKVLYITLLQTRNEIREIFASHGWDIKGIEIAELPKEIHEVSTSPQTIFSTADIELNEISDSIVEMIKNHQPSRVVIDSLSELYVLVDNPHQFRQHLLKLKRLLNDMECTSIFTSGDSRDGDLDHIKTIVHGVIELSYEIPSYGMIRRRLSILKMRGMVYRAGYHDFRILTGGLEVFPSMHLAGETSQTGFSVLKSENSQLDELLGGGLQAGTTCLITGTSGAGKSILANQLVLAAANRGEKSSVFCFDERKEIFLRRAEGVGMPFEKLVQGKVIDLQQINVGDLSLGEFSFKVQESVERNGSKIVIIDSLSGYINAMSEKELVIPVLHELLGYLSKKGVLTVLIVTMSGFYSNSKKEIDASYLADSVILLRHFETQGQVRRCIAVLKKRYGHHENTIRELIITDKGIEIGRPLSDFAGVLTGTPRYEGPHGKLLQK